MDPAYVASREQFLKQTRQKTAAEEHELAHVIDGHEKDNARHRYQTISDNQPLLSSGAITRGYDQDPEFVSRAQRYHSRKTEFFKREAELIDLRKTRLGHMKSLLKLFEELKDVETVEAFSGNKKLEREAARKRAREIDHEVEELQRARDGVAKEIKRRQKELNKLVKELNESEDRKWLEEKMGKSTG